MFRLICKLLWILWLIVAASNALAQAPITFQYFYDSLNQLVRVIDSTGNVITYKYDEVGNLVSVTRTTVASLPPPTLTNVTPNQVNQDDPATVMLIGSGLLGGTVTTTHPGIEITGTGADDNKITVSLNVAPNAQLGPAPFTVTTIRGSTSINITVVGPRPRITAISPAEGPSFGGTAVTVTGKYFTTDTMVTIGVNKATDVTLVNSTMLTAKTPAGPSTNPPTSVDVVVSNPFGSDTLKNGFLYFYGIRYGEIVSGSLDSIGEQDRYLFSGASGDRIYFRMRSAFQGSVRIDRPDGTTLCSQVSVGPAFELSCILDVSGVYTIWLTDRTRSEVGAYTFTLNRLNPPAISTPLAYGQVVTGTHTPAAEIDAHVFTGATGERVYFRMSSAFQGNVWIARPDGTTLCQQVSVGPALDVTCTLDRDGAHTVWVTDRTLSESGAYTFSLNRLNPPAVSTPLTYGQVVSGSHTPPSEVDAYVFTGATGERVYFRMSSAFQGNVWISRPDGTTLCQQVSVGPALDVTCTLDRDGSHAVWVTDRTLNESGAYTFSLNRLNPPAISTPLAYGQVVTGTHTPAAEIDAHVFTGATGERVYFRMSSAFQGNVWIARPDGTTLCQQVSVGPALDVTCTLNVSGLHTVWVTDRTLSESGTYTFTLNRLNPPVISTPITYGQTVSGVHTPAAEVDAYAFKGANSDRVSVRLMSAFQGHVWIGRPDGTTMCSQVAFGPSLQLTCTLDRDGDHTIWITDRTVTEVGAYSVELQRLVGASAIPARRR